jgi:NitT/TauT family transport system permease protein
MTTAEMSEPILFEVEENRERGPWWLRVLKAPILYQVLIVASALSAWQWIPTIHGAAKVSPVLDPFFISSPKRISIELYRLATGSDHTPTIWTPFKNSIVPAIIGTALALVVGVILGLVCSSWRFIDRVSRPFLILFNATPRIVLIPIIILVAGSSTNADVVVGFIVVVFMVFFNAFEGGKSVPPEVMENARIMGAGVWDQLFKIRLPYVLVWTFAILPNAVAFGLTAIVTAELFTGASGMGQLMITAVNTANSDLTFAVVIILAVAALVLITAAELLRKRILHWW